MGLQDGAGAGAGKGAGAGEFPHGFEASMVGGDRCSVPHGMSGMGSRAGGNGSNGGSSESSRRMSRDGEPAFGGDAGRRRSMDGLRRSMDGFGLSANSFGVSETRHSSLSRNSLDLSGPGNGNGSLRMASFSHSMSTPQAQAAVGMGVGMTSHYIDQYTEDMRHESDGQDACDVLLGYVEDTKAGGELAVMCEV